jgi:BNR repeat-like domain
VLGSSPVTMLLKTRSALAIVCTFGLGRMACAAEPVRVLRSAERVVALRGGGYFPVMVKLRDGTLGTVVRGGAAHVGRGGRLDFIRSTNGGRTWSAPVVAADSPWDDRNPALGQMPDGTLVLAYAEARSYRADGTFDLAAGPYVAFRVTSQDGGKTWSAKQALASPIPNPSPFGKINVTRDGTAILTLYEMPSNRVGLLRSRDSGKTWGDWTVLPGHDETQAIEIADGRWLAFTRIEERGPFGLLLSESRDRGRTWINTRRLLKAQQWPYDVTVLKSGKLLLSFGSRVGRFGAGVVLSRDGGRTWDIDHSVLVGWDSLNSDTGYPSTVQLDDGTIVTMYYAVGTKALPGAQAIVVRYTEAQLEKAMRGG